ncbi:hypothetical protein FK531_07530 [Rhodococcus spelaei]|uniref:Uncharacterized protein n=1 Tax=Rhodococcus spelaei TaxID=2546320 RepID=A0A541BM07_9NOCA|nr:hypothetical protein [Rhodococcus spelaei]TQF73355.1 hypothetical protein FK531_07530 [Rhodococcus spelaei]
MSQTRRNSCRKNGRGERHISIRAVRRDPPDLRKLSRAVITLALAEAEAAKQAQVTEAATQDDAAAEVSDD